MLHNKSFNKLTRRGKVIRVTKEHYLRDDISCGLEGCTLCVAGETDAASGSRVDGARVTLNAEPSSGAILVLDTNVILQQMDVLESGTALFNDVVVLGTVLDEVKHKHLPTYTRLVRLVKETSRRFIPFANENHRDTYVPRTAGESANDYSDRLIRTAVSWLEEHYSHALAAAEEEEAEAEGAAAEDGAGESESVHTAKDATMNDAGSSKKRTLPVILLTHDRANAKLAAAAGLTAMTMRQFLQQQSRSRHTTTTAAVPQLLELLAGGDENDLHGSSSSAKSALDMVDALAEDDEIALMPADGASTSTSGSGGAAAASALEATAASISVAKRRGVYPDHLPAGVLAERLKARTAFRGVLRISRDCWYEGRVAVRGLGGGSAATSGGDDVIPLLILGRESLNRAMDGDSVVVELLPQSEWKAAPRRLAPAATTVQEEEQDEKVALAEAATTTTTAAAAAAAATARGAASQYALAAAATAASGVAGGPSPTARVIGILRRSWRPLCGSLEPEPDAPAPAAATTPAASTGESTGVGGADGSVATTSVLFVPVDPRYPRIRMETRQKAVLQDKRIVVALDGWDAHSRYPRGHYVRTIGTIGDKAAENEVILLEHDIPFRPFSADVLACLPAADWRITPDNSRGRTDLRHIDICSIDPPGCKDIDDALHARWVGGGDEVEVGVHIADVTHFVKEGAAIDVEAALRANTTYLVEKRLDMLPGLLTETLCSLKGGVDRFAFSVQWRFRRVPASDPRCANPASAYYTLAAEDRWEMVPGSATFFRSIIHSRAAMTYAQAQALLDDPAAATPIAQGVKLLASVARSLKRLRIEAGALSLASNEVKFMLDSETHEPTDVTAYETRETNSTVEEFMLLGNCAVAERIVQAFPRFSILRRHPAPAPQQFAPLIAAARAVGVEIRTGSSKEVADSLDAAHVKGNPHFNRLLRILATRCMMQATYFSSGEYTPPDWRHYGLAVPTYTHFTSPIRRYADVVAHRLLAAAIGIEPVPAAYSDRATMRALCDNMNRRHLMSQLAGRASASLHTNLFFANRVVVETGLVMKLRANGCVVLVPRFGLEAVILLGAGGGASGGAGAGVSKGSSGSSKDASRQLQYDEVEQVLCDAADSSRLRLCVFQEVRVALLVEQRQSHRKELCYRLLDPPFHSLPPLPPGTQIEDRAAAATTTAASTATASTAAATVTHAGTKRSAAEAAATASPASGAASAGAGSAGGSKGSAAKKARTG